MPVAVKTLCVRLLEPTPRKARILRDLGGAYLGGVNLCRQSIEYWDGFSDVPLTRPNLHHLCYGTLRTAFGLPAQLAIDALTDAWSGRKDTADRIQSLGMPFNIPRSGNLATTKRGNPVVRCRAPTQRIAVPIRRDGASRRLVEHLQDGWTTTFFRIEERPDGWRASIVLRKLVPERPATGMLGVDVGSAVLAAVSAVGPGKQEQRYLGQDVAVVQQRILRRRAVLQEKAENGSSRARRGLRRLHGYERDFTTTRCYQVAHEIVAIALLLSLSIAIEDLSHLRDSPLPRRAARLVGRMPYRRFRAALVSVAAQLGVRVVVVPARNTSRTCARCGRCSAESRKRRWFRCGRCGYCCNADRNAVVVIAQRAMSLERRKAEALATVRPSGGLGSSDEGAVNHPARDNEGISATGPRPDATVSESQPLLERGSGNATPLKRW